MGSGVSVVQPCTKRSDMVLQAEEGDDVKTCCVCLEVLQFDSSSFFRATCCGQGIHRECFHELLNSTMPIQLKASCPYCRRFYPLTNSSVEQFKNCKFWALKEKSWAQTLLGKMYHVGKGVEQSFEQAKYWLELAFGQGDPNAAYTLGTYFLKGKTCPKNYVKAFELYKFAAKYNISDAQYALGSMHEFGYGTSEIDISKAMFWFHKAAKSGHAPSTRAIKMLDLKEEWYKKSELLLVDD
jgi:TPR repeat protein